MNKPMIAEGRSTLVKPKFGPGMLLQHEDLELQSTHTQELNRLMLRSLFGCGVVCGLTVTVNETRSEVTVEAGVAIDSNGDPIEVPDREVIDVSGDCQENEQWVVLSGATKLCVPRTTTCASDDEPTSHATREICVYEIRLETNRPERICQCKKQELDDEPVEGCYDSHINGECDCTSDGCSDQDRKRILLARLYEEVVGQVRQWKVDHSVRRFVRPKLLGDPTTTTTASEPASEPASETTTNEETDSTIERLKAVTGERDTLRGKFETLLQLVAEKQNKDVLIEGINSLGEELENEEVEPDV